MNKLPTAKEFIIGKRDNYNGVRSDVIVKSMIEFAKLHVEAALNSIYENGVDDITSWSGNPYTGEGSYYLDEDKIKKAYPLENIK
jgi:hypothetical protein